MEAASSGNDSESAGADTESAAVAENDTTAEESSLLSELEAGTESDTTDMGMDNLENFRKEYPLFAVLNPVLTNRDSYFRDRQSELPIQEILPR